MKTSSYEYYTDRAKRFKFYVGFTYVTRNGIKLINLGFKIQIVGCSLDEKNEIIGGSTHQPKLWLWESGMQVGTLVLLNIDLNALESILQIARPHEFVNILEQFHTRYSNQLYDKKSVADFSKDGDIPHCYTILEFDKKEDALQCVKELLLSIEKHTSNNRHISNAEDFFENFSI